MDHFELQKGSEDLRRTQTNFWIGTTTGAFNLYVVSKITDPIVSVKIPQVYSYPFQIAQKIDTVLMMMIEMSVTPLGMCVLVSSIIFTLCESSLEI